MPKIIFSKHACYQMVERNILETDIITTINCPDKIISESENKFRAVKLIRKNNKKFLLVIIYRKINSGKKVITAFLTTKIKKYLTNK